ncbi:MAG TPA: acyl-CoA dehydrogenase [Acidimicrobiales bacterium]|nr:acyl-CoA dehydrogenase [Acidimicrobiales bacterium]
MSVDDVLLSTAERIFAGTCTFDAIEAAEADGWAPSVWSALAEAGLPWISVPERAGGVGGSLEDALAVLRIAGRHAAPVPLAETGLLAGWLASSGGLQVAEGPATLVPGSARDTVALTGATLSGIAYGVPWASRAGQLVVLVANGTQWKVATVATSAVAIESTVNLAGEPRDTVHFDSSPIGELASTTIDAEALERRGALTRIMLMAGAMERMNEITLAYTSQRQQFGRPVARFQLVQAHLVHLAQDTALLGIAADAAARAAAVGEAAFEIAAARTLAGATVATATRAAHQAHGAMGMTREYPLHHLSRRLWSWRLEYGKEYRWQLAVGAHAAKAGPDALYGLVTG